MKIRRSKERWEDVVVTVRSADLEGDARFVYGELLKTIEKENRRRKHRGGRGIGYTVQLEESTTSIDS